MIKLNHLNRIEVGEACTHHVPSCLELCSACS